MHRAAREWTARYATTEPVTVLELGSRNINGSSRDLFPAASWFGIDIADGPGVDLVADAATYRHHEPVDVVVCNEVLEHTPAWEAIVVNAIGAVRSGGLVILTAAGPRRRPHSALGGGPPRPGEWYQNIDPADLGAVLKREMAGRGVAIIDSTGVDVRAVIWR